MNNLNHINNNLNNDFNYQLLNKGYFRSINKKMIYTAYMMIKNEFKKKLGIIV